MEDVKRELSSYEHQLAVERAALDAEKRKNATLQVCMYLWNHLLINLYLRYHSIAISFMKTLMYGTIKCMSSDVWNSMKLLVEVT